jgi:cytoskeletal protein CcmA (bactofilin family)
VTDLSTIGRGTTIRGNVRGNGDLDVHGRVEGSIAVKGELSIGETALIRSDISGRSVIVRGAVAGNVTAEESLVLEAGARVVGDLSAPRIGIRPGALLRGNVSTDGAGAPAARAANASASRGESARSHVAASAPKPVARPAPSPLHPPPRAQPPAPKPVVLAARVHEEMARPNGPPPPVVPTIGKNQKATLKRKGAR